MLLRNPPDRIRIAFDDCRLVANAGLLLPATLAQHLGLPQMVQKHLDLGDGPDRAQARAAELIGSTQLDFHRTANVDPTLASV